MLPDTPGNAHWQTPAGHESLRKKRLTIAVKEACDNSKRDLLKWQVRSLLLHFFFFLAGPESGVPALRFPWVGDRGWGILGT